MSSPSLPSKAEERSEGNEQNETDVDLSMKSLMDDTANNDQVLEEKEALERLVSIGFGVRGKLCEEGEDKLFCEEEEEEEEEEECTEEDDRFLLSPGTVSPLQPSCEIDKSPKEEHKEEREGRPGRPGSTPSSTSSQSPATPKDLRVRRKSPRRRKLDVEYEKRRVHLGVPEGEGTSSSRRLRSNSSPTKSGTPEAHNPASAASGAMAPSAPSLATSSPADPRVTGDHRRGTGRGGVLAHRQRRSVSHTDRSPVNQVQPEAPSNHLSGSTLSVPHSRLSSDTAHWEHREPLDRHYVFGNVITTEEDSNHEFKWVKSEQRAVERIASYIPKYVNAFLNSNGGVIYFGVRDDGVITGVALGRKQRDDLRLRIDNTINTMFTPQVDPYLLRLEFIKVIRFKSRHSRKQKSYERKSHRKKGATELDSLPSLSRKEYIKSELSKDKSTALYVVELHISQGRAPVYLLHMSHRAKSNKHRSENRERSTVGRREETGDGKDDDDDGPFAQQVPEELKNKVAYIRREGSVHVMSPEMIVERMKLGRPSLQAQSVVVATPRVFIGREEEIIRIRQFVSAGAGEKTLMVVLYGLPVVGKSSLAHKLATEMEKRRYTDPCVVVDMKGTTEHYINTEEAMVGVIRMTYPTMEFTRDTEVETEDEPTDNHLQEPNHGGRRTLSASARTLSREVKGLYESCFKGKHTVLLIENVGSTAQIEALIPHSASSVLVLVTSRKNLAVDEADTLFLEDGNCLFVKLSALKELDAVRLLQSLAPHCSHEHAVRIAQLCGCLPLPLKIIGSTLKRQEHVPTEVMLERLQAEDERLHLVEGSLTAVLQCEPDGVHSDLLALSLFLSSFDGRAAAAVLGTVYYKAMDIMGYFVDCGWLELLGEHNRYVQNDLVRLYFIKRRRKATEVEVPIKRRFIRHYLGYLKTIRNMIVRSSGKPIRISPVKQGHHGAEDEMPETEAGKAWRMLMLDKHNFEACLIFAGDLGYTEHPVELKNIITELLGYWDLAAAQRWVK